MSKSKNKIRVLGIDPGSVICGYGVVDKIGNEFHLVEYGAIKAKKLSGNFNQRLNYIFEYIDKVVKRTEPDITSVETMFYSKNVQSLIKLSHARSAAILGVVQNELDVIEYSPNEVKKSVTGKGKANKEQVQFMVKRLLNIKEDPKYYDSTDALAVAICHCVKSGERNLSSSNSWKDFVKNNPDRVL